MLKHAGFTKEEQLKVMKRVGYSDYEEFDPNSYYDLFDWD